jgi:hypothetical protein
MDCRSVEEAILDSLENAGTAGVQRQIDVHLAGCPACTAFAARQQSVDAQLGGMLVPPELSPVFAKLYGNGSAGRQCAVGESLPDKVRYLSCGSPP